MHLGGPKSGGQGPKYNQEIGLSAVRESGSSFVACMQYI